MKRIAYLLIFFIVSCNHIQQEKNDLIIDNEEKEVNNNKIIDNGLSIEIIKLINEMSLFYDSIDNGAKENILAIYFIKEKNDCFINICEVPNYTPHVKYYTLFNDYLIIIYNTYNECYYDLVDTTKLEKFNGIPFELYELLFDTTINYFDTNKKIEEFEKNMTKIEGFPSESNYIYDPIGKKYKIHSKDSLELTFTGYL